MKTNLVEFPDLLYYATSVGYGWNEARDILVEACVVPMYEIATREFELEYLDEYINQDSEAYKIVEGFMKKNNVTEITVINS